MMRSTGTDAMEKEGMLGSTRKLVAAAVCATSMTMFASFASATPIANGLAIKSAVPAQVESVQWRRGWGWRGGGWGWRGVGAGFVAGALIGGAIAASPYYGYGGGYGGYYYGGPYYAPAYSAAPVYYGGGCCNSGWYGSWYGYGGYRRVW
jgi:hypothetical protein